MDEVHSTKPEQAIQLRNIKIIPPAFISVSLDRFKDPRVSDDMPCSSTDHENGLPSSTSKMTSEKELEILQQQVDELTGCVDIAREQVANARRQYERTINFFKERLEIVEQEASRSREELEFYKGLAAGKDTAENLTKKIIEPKGREVSDLDVELLAIITPFLIPHSNTGCSVEYIWHHVLTHLPLIDIEYVETVLKRFPLLFDPVTINIEYPIETTWKFVGFE